MLGRHWKSTIVSSIVFIVLNQGASVVAFVSSHSNNMLMTLVFPKKMNFWSAVQFLRTVSKKSWELWKEKKGGGGGWSGDRVNHSRCTMQRARGGRCACSESAHEVTLVHHDYRSWPGGCLAGSLPRNEVREGVFVEIASGIKWPTSITRSSVHETVISAVLQYPSLTYPSSSALWFLSLMYITFCALCKVEVLNNK
jgi:hypothetical protein